MKDLGDYLNKKARDLGLDRQEVLADVQDKLDEMYPGKARAKSLNDGVLRITTSSSAVASEIRLKQGEFTNNKDVQKVVIKIS